MPRVEVAPGAYVEVPQERLEEFLSQLNAQREANPLTGYFPYDHQKQYHAAKTPIKALIAGNQSGKTHCSLADDLIQLLDEDAIPEHLKPYKRWTPPVTIWIGAPKVAKIFDTLLPKLRELCPKSQLKGGSLDGAFSSQHKTIDFTNGSQIVFKTYDQDVDAYSGASIHRMHWDEEPEGEHGLQIRHEARIRLLKHEGDECLSMTPLFGLSWVYEHIYERRSDPNITVVNADMDDNLSLSEESKKETLAMFTKEERDARKSGRFVHFKGLVYDEFSDDLHVVDTPEISHVKRLDVVEGIDPGIRTTGVSFWGFDGENSMLKFDELYLHDEDAIPENAAKLIKAKRRAWGIDPIYTVIDPSARNRSIQTGERLSAAFLRAGIPTIPGNADDVETGVFEVKRRLQMKDAKGNPAPMYLIARNCVKTIWELGRYRMDDRADGKFAVVKQDDHLLDADRYVAMSRPIGPTGSAADPTPTQWIPGTAPSLEEMNDLAFDPSPPLGSLT